MYTYFREDTPDSLGMQCKEWSIACFMKCSYGCCMHCTVHLWCAGVLNGGTGLRGRERKGEGKGGLEKWKGEGEELNLSLFSLA